MTKSTVPLFIVIGLTLMLVTPVWADFQAGVYAYNRGDYNIALKEFQPLAEQGHVGSQHHLGEMYARGLGVSQDYQVAAHWYRFAAAHQVMDGGQSLSSGGNERHMSRFHFFDELVLPSFSFWSTLDRSFQWFNCHSCEFMLLALGAGAHFW